MCNKFAIRNKELFSPDVMANSHGNVHPTHTQNPSSFFSAKHVSNCQVVINVEDLAATDPDDSLEHGASMKQQRLDLIKFTVFHEKSDVGEVAPWVTYLVHSSLLISNYKAELDRRATCSGKTFVNAWLSGLSKRAIC